MSSLQMFGVPLTDGSRKGIFQPLVQYRFRVVDCADSITQNTSRITFDFAKKELDFVVRGTVLSSDMIDVMNFAARAGSLRIEALDGTDKGIIFGLAFHGLQVVSHKFAFDYASSEVANHEFKITYASMTTHEPKQLEEQKGLSITPGHVTPAQAVEAMNKSD